MKKILCPTDFSDMADNATIYAAKLAHRLGAQLDLFNVQSLGDLTPQQVLYGKSMNIAAANDLLEERCKEIAKVFKISCYGDVESSVTSVVNLIAAKGNGYDLIVMATNGPDDMVKFFLGSNTYQVIRKSSVPVILVPVGCGYSDITSAVFAFDYWRSNELPITQLLKFVNAVGSEVTVLQVMEESHSSKTDWEIKETQKILMDLYKDEIELKFDVINASDLVESIDEYVSRKQADLLALCTENHGFIKKMLHKSVVKAISAKATYPVFVFHE